jgi:hypothetical protein
MLTPTKTGAPASPVAAGDLIPQANCERCDSIIPQASIMVKMKRQWFSGFPRASITAYCEHCNRIFESARELRDGQWWPTGETVIVTNANQRRAILAKINKISGDTDVTENDAT